MKTNSNVKVNSNKVAVDTVSMKVTANQLYTKLLSTTELKKEFAKNTYEKVEFDGKVQTVNSYGRNYFVEAYKKAENLGTSAEWTQRLIIAGTMDNESYKDCFVSDADFANQIGQSKAYISKAKDAVEIRNWLIDNKYGSDWKPSTVEELIKVFKDFKKKSLDFNEFMRVTGLTSSATTAVTREAKKKYNESLVSNKVDGQENTEDTNEQENTEDTNEQAAVTVNEIKQAYKYQSMTININFEGLDTMVIDLNNEEDRKLANTILTALKPKVRVAANKMGIIK